MGSTLGISTQSTWAGARSWPGLYNEIDNVKFSTQYGNGKPGGPAAFSCDVICPSYKKAVGIAPGRILRVWRGAENIWTGIINQPDTGGEGVGVTADGIGGAYADRFICTEKNNALFLDDNIDAAIARGMPWTRTAASPFYFGMMNPGVPLRDALNEITKQTGQDWSVSPTGLLTWAPTTPSTTVNYLLWAYGQGGARTLDEFGTDFYASYLPVEDVQIDKIDSAPSVQSGGAWQTNASFKHGDSEASAYGTGAGTGVYLLPLHPIDIRGYASVVLWAMMTSGVSRNLQLILYAENGTEWDLGTQTMNMTANVWTKRTFALDNKPAGFDLTQWRGCKFGVSGTLYVDDLWAISPVIRNSFGVFAPQVTTDQANAAGRVQYGRHEVTVDLTSQGQLGATDATSAAAAALTKYGYRPRWTQPFLATKNSLTTTRGVPVDLAGVAAGSRVRVMLADLGDAEIGTTGAAVEFVVGATEYDDQTGTLTVTPVDTTRKDLVTLLGSALPPGRKTKA